MPLCTLHSTLPYSIVSLSCSSKQQRLGTSMASVCWEPSPGLRMTAYLLYPHKADTELCSLHPLTKAQSHYGRSPPMTLSKPDYSPKAKYLQTPSLQGLGLQLLILGGGLGRHKHSVHRDTLPSVSFKLGYLEMSLRPLRAMSERPTGWAPEPHFNLFYCVSFCVNSPLGKDKRLYSKRKFRSHCVVWLEISRENRILPNSWVRRIDSHVLRAYYIPGTVWSAFTRYSI